MEMENILKLIQTVSDSTLSSFKYEEGDSCLVLELNGNKNVALNLQENGISAMKANLPFEMLNMNQINVNAKEAKVEKEVTGELIKSPLVGIFYAAKAEGAEPFVKLGDKVKKGQIIGIVEAMKLMNEVESPYDGIVEEILVENAQLVEYGQPMVRIGI